MILHTYLHTLHSFLQRLLHKIMSIFRAFMRFYTLYIDDFILLFENIELQNRKFSLFVILYKYK